MRWTCSLKSSIASLALNFVEALGTNARSGAEVLGSRQDCGGRDCLGHNISPVGADERRYARPREHARTQKSARAWHAPTSSVRKSLKAAEISKKFSELSTISLFTRITMK